MKIKLQKLGEDLYQVLKIEEDGEEIIRTVLYEGGYIQSEGYIANLYGN